MMKKSKIYGWALGLAGLLAGTGAAAAETAAAETAAAPADKAAAEVVPLKRLKLYTSGAGYFEHDGKVRDNAALTLSFKAEQMNSLLKSLVVRDFNGGSIDDISYPTLSPLCETLSAFPINVAENLSRYKLLERLRGAQVRFTPADGGAEFTAAVLGVEKKSSANQLPVETVNILRANGEIAGVALSSIRHFTPADPRLAKELGNALAALAASRDNDRKPFTMNFNGQGERRVAFGYVLDMPVWKPAYRLTLNENGKDAFIQGWAIVENRTDTDWRELELSLVAGAPNNIRAELYGAPQPKPEHEVNGAKPAFARRAMKDSAAAMEDAAMPAALSAPAAFNAASGRRQASAAAMGEMFAYKIASPVTLARRQATMLEIVTGDLPAEKVLIFNPDQGRANPDNAVFLQNKSGKTLLAGPVAVFDQGYGGDASLDHLADNGEVYVRYSRALDIKAESFPTQHSAITAVKFSKGTIQAKVTQESSTRYVFRNPGKKNHTLILDVQQMPGWTLTDNLQPWKSENFRHKFRVAVNAGQNTEFTVKWQRVNAEIVALTGNNFWDNANRICVSGALTPAQKEAWNKAVALRQQAAALEKQYKDGEAALREMGENQERTRKNLNTLNDRESELYKQLTARLAEEIKRTDVAQQENQQRKAALRAAEQALADYLQGLEI